jgi:hypothetical protein
MLGTAGRPIVDKFARAQDHAQWHWFGSNCRMQKSSRRCGGSINSGTGNRWMKCAVAWVAQNSSPDVKFRSSAMPPKRFRSRSFAQQSIAIPILWIGRFRPEISSPPCHCAMTIVRHRRRIENYCARFTLFAPSFEPGGGFPVRFFPTGQPVSGLIVGFSPAAMLEFNNAASE